MGMLQRLRHIHIFLLKHMPKFEAQKNTIVELIMKKAHQTKTRLARVTLSSKKNKCITGVITSNLIIYWVWPPNASDHSGWHETCWGSGTFICHQHPWRGTTPKSYICTYIIHTYIEVKGLALTVGEAFWVWGHTKTGRGILFWIKTSTFSGQMFWGIS